MLLALSACATIETSTPTQQASEATDSVPTVVLDTAQREALLTAIQSLEGRWKDPEIGETVLEVTSGGSVVRETMFPGQPHEMTNMYSLDLNDLRETLARGGLALVLISAFQMLGVKVPHWVLVIGDTGTHFVIHDPFVDYEVSETPADCSSLPISHSLFLGMAQFGKQGLRACLLVHEEPLP